MEADAELLKRWNREASLSGYAGSEFYNAPETVFRRVRDTQHRLHIANLDRVKLQRQIAGLTKLGVTPDGGVIVGPQGFERLTVTDLNEGI